jgi:predicted DNA-binding transcriptional regulator AlpA
MRRDEQMPDWPAAMRRSTAARYLDISEAEFAREVASGKIPPPFRLGRSDHWSKKSIDGALGLCLDPPGDDRCGKFETYRTEPPSEPVDASVPDMPAIFTPERLAEHWGMSVAKIYSLFRSGELVGFRLGKKLIRFRAAEVAAAEERMGASS